MDRNEVSLLEDVFRYLDEQLEAEEALEHEPDNKEIQDKVTAARRFVAELERKLDAVREIKAGRGERLKDRS